MAKRKSIPKGVRWRTLAATDFRCVYCGRRAGDVALEIDHIHPVARDGGNAEANLVAACEDCNSGKSAQLWPSVTTRADAVTNAVTAALRAVGRPVSASDAADLAWLAGQVGASRAIRDAFGSRVYMDERYAEDMWPRALVLEDRGLARTELEVDPFAGLNPNGTVPICMLVTLPAVLVHGGIRVEDMRERRAAEHVSVRARRLLEGVA